ncbi:MAG: citrate lyase holo-[acyl-carrier protein] synthase [Eubacteriales bacterium]|nr:citrate lyase holo-[acyl-carrier protein] synthase [Eubacteriales bacterium]
MEQQVTLIDMLDARERRAFHQQKLLTTYQSPMICFTMNIAGPIKNSTLIRKGFELGNRYLKEQLQIAHMDCLYL